MKTRTVKRGPFGGRQWWPVVLAAVPGFFGVAGELLRGAPGVSRWLLPLVLLSSIGVSFFMAFVTAILADDLRASRNWRNLDVLVCLASIVAWLGVCYLYFVAPGLKDSSAIRIQFYATSGVMGLVVFAALQLPSTISRFWQHRRTRTLAKQSNG